MHEIMLYVQANPVLGAVGLLLVVMLVLSALKSLFKLMACLLVLVLMYGFFLHTQGKELAVLQREWVLPKHVR
jgi:hypothetical protein